MHNEITRPQVSVIMPTYSRAGMVMRTIDSVLRQTMRDFEFIIVNDCSTDNTINVLNAITDPRIKVVNKVRNTGQTMSINAGLDVAMGEYVAFIDDDDEWLPDKLEKQIELLCNLPQQVAMVHGWHDELDLHDNRVVKKVRNRYKGNVYEDMLWLSLPYPTSIYMVRMSAIKSVGNFGGVVYYNGIRDYGNDKLFMCELVKYGYEVDYVPSVIMLKYKHTDTMTGHINALYAYIEMLEHHKIKYLQELKIHKRSYSALLIKLAMQYAKTRNIKKVILYLSHAWWLSPAYAGTYTINFYHRRLKLLYNKILDWY